MSGPSLKSRLFLKLLKNTRAGTLHLTLPNGQTEVFGEGLPQIHVQVQEWEVLDDLINRGDLGLAESIIEGKLVVDDTSALVQWACENDSAMERFIHGSWYGTLFDRLHRLLTINSRRGAKKNIMAHYDLGNDFYRLWLDETMTYSSGIFHAEDLELKQAQYAKYDRIIESLNIGPGDHVLEIGCGWGGFFSRAVEKTGCKVTAVMNSPSQAKYNQELIRRRGLEGSVELRQQDYRDIEGRFDKVVSIEMIEAVGERYWDSFFGKVSASLKPGGSALIQSITIDNEHFETYRQKTDFIQRYIFPGGMLLAPKLFSEYGGRAGLNADRPFEFGISYAETLKKWREQFQKAEAEVRALGFDERFLRLWNLYLSYCEGAFRAERINVGHYQLGKQGMWA